MDPTGSSLVQFWVDVGERGQMNANTAGSYRSACEAVLSAQPNWQSLDVRRLDIDRLIAEFQRTFGDHLTEATMKTYESNFKRAVPSFVNYLDNPQGWSPPVRPRRSTALALSTTATSRPTADSGRPPPSDEQPVAPIDLPIPLTDGRTARLTLPGGLTKDDVELLREVIPVYLNRIPTREP